LIHKLVESVTSNNLNKVQYLNTTLQGIARGICIHIVLAAFCKAPALSQTPLPATPSQSQTPNSKVQLSDVEPLQVAPDSHLESPEAAQILSQTPVPITPSEQLDPNRNIPTPGIDPLQIAPDAQVDELKPDEPLPQNIEEQDPKLTEQLVRNALLNTAGRYPWIIDPTDRYTFSALLFRPGSKQIYSSFDLQTADDTTQLNRFRIGRFSNNDSFYWVLDNNRVVIETKGHLAGVTYQGESQDISITRKMDLVQSYGGNQFVTALAPDIEGLLENPDTAQGNGSGSSILTVAAQVINPPGTPLVPIAINNPAIIRDSGNVTNLTIPSQSNLFNNIDVANAPTVLQAFPTVNLQPLAELALYSGETVPEEVLEEAGIKFGSIFRGISPEFTPSVSSVAGIKTLQLGRFDNPDLLRMLLDRSLDQGNRKVHYFNSLYWSSFGIRAENQSEEVKPPDINDWYQLYASQAHNRIVIEYHPEEPEATFTQVFANPGISLTVRPNTFDVDETQSLSATLGLLPGLLFKQLNPQGVNQLLQTARQRYNNHQIFTPLQTKATSEQRRQINRRLNSTLAFTNIATGIEQLSGLMTFSSRIHPSNSALWQVRTGLHRRRALFFEVPSPTVTSEPIRFGNLRLSSDRFGPLGFGNAIVPETTVSDGQQSNESFAVQTLVTTANGNQFLFENSSAGMAGVPIPGRSTALVFDRFELLRTETSKGKNHVFFGSLFLPAAEMVFSGTQGNFNYSIGAGAWLNPNSDKGLNVGDNQSQFQEPGLGLYARATLSHTNLSISRDAQGIPQTIFNFIPSLTVRWNSAANDINQNVVALSSVFSYQNKKLAFTIIPGIQYTDEFIAVLPATVQFSNGLTLEASLEVGKRTYYRFEALKSLNKRFSLGLYTRNFTDIDNSRIPGDSYGFKVRYNLPTTSLFTDFTLGTGSNGLDLRLQGSLSF
jgi:hypothetical protein